MVGGYGRFVGVSVICLLALVVPATEIAAQDVPASDASQPDHTHMNMDMDMDASGWQFMQDGVAFGMFNHQGGPRGADEIKMPNWWMGMMTRKVRSSQFTLNAMFSLDPATTGKNGYSEIFQVGEELNDRPLIDRQHPHDLFMQLAAIWRTPVTSTTGLTVAGGLAGEPALGPVAFMHRASAAEFPLAPLSHHTFDSTHVAFGVITAAVDHGPWVVEGSVFNGREPDDNRWNFDFGRLDSVSGRVWYRPTPELELQVSTGHLTNPESLEPGNIQRTTASGSWFGRNGDDFLAVTVGYGINATNEANRQAIFGEATRRVGSNVLFGRVEIVQVETNLLLNDAIPLTEAAALTSTVGAFTFGGVRDVGEWHGFEGGLGAALTVYAVPDVLKASYGNHPASFQVYFRIRPPAGKMGRMWNMRMSQPMAGSGMAMP